VSRHKFDLTGLMLPTSSYLFRDTMVRKGNRQPGHKTSQAHRSDTRDPPQTDEEHDSVHAHVPPPPSPSSGKMSGRQLDQGIKKVDSSPPVETMAVAGKKRSSVHSADNPDEYDFWVNVCTPVVGAPAVCDGKGPAAGYQVVVPKQDEHSDEEELQMFDDYERRAIARERALQEEEGKVSTTPSGGDSFPGDGGQPKQLHRSARSAPEAKECHALGALDNVTWSVITPRAPAHGVSLTYNGGDQCLKKVIKRTPPPPPPAGKKGQPAKKPEVGVTYSATEVEWVPVPRSLTLHIRCDPEDSGVKDFASFLQLTRRVRVVETEMCSYVVEWPSKLGCGVAPRNKALRAAAALAHPLRAPFWLLVGVLAAVGWQLSRQWHALAILWPALMRGDAAAWRRARALLLSKVRSHDSSWSILRDMRTVT